MGLDKRGRAIQREAKITQKRHKKHQERQAFLKQLETGDFGDVETRQPMKKRAPTPKDGPKDF